MHDEITPKVKKNLRGARMWAIKNLGAVQLPERAARVSHLGCWDGVTEPAKLHGATDCTRRRKKIVEARLTRCLVAMAAEPY
jgi:hypothetical protein